MGWPDDEYEEWQLTPWWHPARWFGFDMRRYQNHEPYDRGWDYAWSQKLARRLLEQEYGGK